MLLPVAAAILVGGVLVLLGAFGDGDDSGGETETPSEEVQAEIDEARTSLTRSLNDKRQGISARYPASWRSRTLRGERVLESRDRCAAIKLSAPAGAEQAGRLRRDTIAAMRRGFEGAAVAPAGPGKQLGGLTVTQDVITVPIKRGGTVRILVSVGRGEELAYLTEVLLRDPSCGQSLLEAQLIVESLRFSR